MKTNIHVSLNKNPILTSQWTDCVAITDAKRLLFLKEVKLFTLKTTRNTYMHCVEQMRFEYHKRRYVRLPLGLLMLQKYNQLQSLRFCLLTSSYASYGRCLHNLKTKVTYLRTEARGSTSVRISSIRQESKRRRKSEEHSDANLETTASQPRRPQPQLLFLTIVKGKEIGTASYIWWMFTKHAILHNRYYVAKTDVYWNVQQWVH